LASHNGKYRRDRTVSFGKDAKRRLRTQERTMKKTYTGGCQCGKVRYEAQADIGAVIMCNCSRCRRLGPLLSAIALSDFRLLSGENEMTDYQFNKRTVHHPFCKTCGIESYAYGKGPGGRDMVMLNVRCLDGVEVDQFEVKKFDGASL
jgi:hypothetical protein